MLAKGVKLKKRGWDNQPPEMIKNLQLGRFERFFRIAACVLKNKTTKYSLLVCFEIFTNIWRKITNDCRSSLKKNVLIFLISYTISSLYHKRNWMKYSWEYSEWHPQDWV